jgi:hypothetical protein
MGSDLVCGSDGDAIWLSLSCLWEEIRQKGQGQNVSIPVIGSDMARTGLSRMILIKLIILSFVVASKKKFVCKQLTIIVYPEDFDSINLYDIADFMEANCY